MPRQPESYIALHKAADYYEPLFRTRFVRAMKNLQSRVSINQLAILMGDPRQVKRAVPNRNDVATAIESTSKVFKDAFGRGGKLGAERIRKL